MKKYASFRMPQIIHYGRQAFDEVGIDARLKGEKALIVSDKIMDNLGYINRACEHLNQAGVKHAIYTGVESEPTDIYVAEALDLFEKENCDVVISLGGGSCIDTAKAIAVLVSNEGYIDDYTGGAKIAAAAPIPHIAIPTRAGTGYEATDATVILNTSNDEKMMIKQPAFMPDTAIVDPLLTLSSLKCVTAATGVDALSHAIEAYISKPSNPMTDTLAFSAMQLIVDNLLTAYEDGENLDAREAMSQGALQAGIAFSNASVCLVHGMSRPIGALFHVPHGFSNAMLLPAVLEYSKEACVERLADLGRIFDKTTENMSDHDAADFAVASVKKLCLSLHIPNLKAWGIDKQAFAGVISKMAEDALASGSPRNNPIVPEQADIESLYKTCYAYSFEVQKK